MSVFSMDKFRFEEADLRNFEEDSRREWPLLHGDGYKVAADFQVTKKPKKA